MGFCYLINIHTYIFVMVQLHFILDSLYIWIILHTLFKIIENNKYGVKLLNKIPFWPGGKLKMILL